MSLVLGRVLSKTHQFSHPNSSRGFLCLHGRSGQDELAQVAGYIKYSRCDTTARKYTIKIPTPRGNYCMCTGATRTTRWRYELEQTELASPSWAEQDRNDRGGLSGMLSQSHHQSENEAIQTRRRWEWEYSVDCSHTKNTGYDIQYDLICA